MADPILEFDPAAEATGTALTITGGNYGLTSFNAPAPPPKMQWAGSVDTEGSALAASGHENRTITIGLEVTGATALADLQSKLAKIHREGGTLKYTSPAATAHTYDVLIQDGWTPTFDHLHYLGGVTSCQFSLTCKPYGRGAEQDLGDNTETTLPALVFTEASIPGDVPALGRLVIDNDVAVDQWWLTWGVQSRYYSSSANAALFYEAEGRTVMGGSATQVGASPASGGGSNTVRNSSLTTTYQAILSTQATGAGAHLSHIGTFRVYARVGDTSATNPVTLALEWSEGDFLAYTRNAPVTVESLVVKWRLVDLGLVSLRPVTAGTQRWEGRIIAKAEPGSDIGIDYLLLVPVSEGSGIVSGVQREVTPTALSARDEFTSTTAGNALNARAAPAGGTWATSGAATDFTFADALTDGEGVVWDEHITRAAVGLRYAILGSTNYTNVRVAYKQGTDHFGYIIARWTDVNNHLVGRIESGAVFSLITVVSGSETVLATTTLQNDTARMVLTATTTGVATLQAYSTAGALIGTLSGYSSVLATGGTLATGKPGLAAAGSTTRFDDFSVSVPPLDAAVFASQSIEIRHDRVNREDSGGTLWVKPSSYAGDYLLVPPSGAETRTTRMVVKMARNDPTVVDPAIDDLSARLFVTPRYLAPPA